MFESVGLGGIDLGEIPYYWYFRNNKNKLAPNSQR